MLDDEEKKKREEEARQIISNMTNSKDAITTINYSNYNIQTNNDNEKEYINKIKEANNIINSINPRENISAPSIDKEEALKSQENAMKFINLMDNNIDQNQQVIPSNNSNSSNNITPSERKNGTKSKEEIDQQIQQAQKQTVNQNTNKINSKVSLSNTDTKIGLANQQEIENAQKLTSTGISAMQNANKKNENIDKGGIDKFNEIADTVLNNIYGGVKQTVSGLANVATTIAGLGIRGLEGTSKILGFDTAADKLNEVYNNIVDTGNDISETANYEKTINSQVKNNTIRTTGDITNVISNMVTSQLIGYATGVSGTTIQGLSVGGNSAQETLNKNKENIAQATITGIAKGYTSYLTEKMFDANILTKGLKKTSIENGINRLISNKINSDFGKEFANKTVGIIGENIEELVEDNAGYLIDKLINNEDLPSFQQWWNNTTETARITTLSTFIMGLMGLGGQNFKDIEKDMETQYWIEEAEKIIEKENLGIHFNKNEVKDLNTIQDFYITRFTPEGEIANIVPTKGIEIENTNSSLNVTPVIVRDSETSNYNIIDGNTGVMLDSIYYQTRLEAEQSYNEKVNKLSDLQIKDINNKINEANYMITNRIMNIVNEAKEQLQQNTISDTKISNSDLININAQSNSNIDETSYISKSENPLKMENRTSQNVNNDNILPYQQEYPIIGTEIQEMAFNFQEDLANSISGERYKAGDTWTGQKRSTTKELAQIKDETGASWDKISQALEDINNNRGNYALAKKIEIVLDEALTNGYTNIYGKTVMPNESYISKKSKIEGKDYHQENTDYDPTEYMTDEDMRPFGEKIPRKGGNDDVRTETIRKSTHTRQEGLDRNNKEKNTRGEKEISRSNEVDRKELSRSLQKYEKEQQKKLGKDFKATLVEKDKLTNVEKIISEAFTNITGVDYNIYTTNKGTTQSAFYIDNNIFGKHNTLSSKKKANFLPFHEYGHWLREHYETEWKKIFYIVNNTITEQQISDYKNVLADQTIFDNMNDIEIRNYIENEIVSDYIGNWANDIINWADMINSKKIPSEYIRLLIDISNENTTTHYPVFGTELQQEQVYNKISEVMTTVLNQNNNTIVGKDNIEYSNRNDVENKPKFSKQLYNSNGQLKTFQEQLDINERLNTPLLVMEDSFEITDNKNPIFIPKRVISKAQNTHGISKQELYDLPNEMKNYVLITKSQNENQKNSIIVFLDKFDYKKEPIIVTMELNKDQQIYTINEITSIYGRSNIEDFLSNKVNNKVLKINDKKIKNWLNSVRVQFPEELNRSLHNSIPSNNLNVKSNKNTIISNNTQNKKNNTRFSDRKDITKDNQGRTLSKKQQEFFKDSKVRDSKGNLLVMYHGTKDDFTIFKHIDGKYDSGFAGKGFYFTSGHETAIHYSDWKKGNNSFEPKVMEVYLNIKNPLIIDELPSGIKLAVFKALNLDFKPTFSNVLKITKEESEKMTKALIEQGYDGIIYEFDGDTLALVLDSKQIKNTDNTNPTSNDDIRYSDRYDIDKEGNYGFYSQLEKVIEEKMPNTSNSQQIQGILNNAGIKQDEMKWIGLDDYLKVHSLEKISKQELLDYIKANQIKIETVQKGYNKIRELTEPIKKDIEDKKKEIKKYLDKYDIAYEEDDVVPYKRNGTRSGTLGDFMADSLEKLVDLEQYPFETVNGVKRYTKEISFSDGVRAEIYFTEQELKENMKDLEYLYEELNEAQMNLSMIEDEHGDYADEIGIPKYKDYALEGGENYQERLYTVNYNSDNNNFQLANVDEYNSPHWSEKNVLAHVRTQDFNDINENKVLFIDEIQSDLHQEGRKKGYISKEISNKRQEINNRINELKDEYSAYELERKNLVSKAFNNIKETYIKKQNEAIKQSSLLEEKYNIQNNLSKEQQYELLDYVSKIEDYLIMQDRQFMIFRENIDNDEYMINQVKEAEKLLKLKLSKEILNKQKDKSIYQQHAIESFRIGHYDQSNIRYGTLWSNNNLQYLSKEEQDRAYELEKLTDKISDERVSLESKKNLLSTSKISDIFPFKKNWHEFALRRIINDAVQQGYDEVAWTTGRQQRERYNLAKAIDEISYYKPDNISEEGISITAKKDGRNVLTKTIMANELADYIGKDISIKILNSKDREGTISNLDETINENPNSGMYLFYDKEIPNYLNKYLKKWNSKVEVITLKDTDGKDESKQPGFKITDEMRNSIKQNGQPLFTNRQLDEEYQSTPYDERIQAQNKTFIEEYKKNMYRDNLMNVDNTAGQTNAQDSNRIIEQEIQKIETTGRWDNSIPVTKLTDIRKTIEDYLGLGIKKGKFRERAYGIYKANRDVIRVKEYKDIDNILHETGHAMDLGNRIKIDKESISKELLKAVERHGGYENESRQVQLDEGFAEVIREYCITPTQAKLDYPNTVSILERLRQKDTSFNNFITKVQQQTYNYIHQNPRNRALSNISIGEQTDKPMMSKEYIRQEVMRNIWDKDYALKSAVNELAKAGNKTTNEIKASENAYYLTRLVSGIGGKVTSILSDGYIDEKGNQLMPGLNKIGDILGNNPERFNDLRAYLVAQRDLEYKAKTLKTGIRTMDSKSVVEQFKHDKQIQQAAQLVYDTLDGVLQYAVNNHLIEQDTADTLRESNAFYVPMQRVLGLDGNNVGKRGSVSEIIKKRTGSELDIKDVLENIIVNSSNVIQQVENNNILKALYKEGELSGLTGTIYDVIPTPMTKIGTAKLSTWENELINQGVDIKNLDLEKTIDIFVPDKKIDLKNLITSFINDNGKRIYLQFYDELVFNSVMNMDKQFMSKVLKISSKLNMPLRYGATMANLGFAIPNMISDTAQATIYSTAGFIPVVDNAIGVLAVLAATNKTARNFLNKVAPQYAEKINAMYTLYQQTGATNATRMSQYRETTQNLMKDIYGTKNSQTLGIQEKYKPLKRLLDILTYIPELSEQSTRFRVFERNYDYYKNKGTIEMDARIMAALESRDATQDFSRTGNFTREVNQFIPFSAARVGSLYTFTEKIKANPKQVGMRIAILTVIAMAIKAIGYDDDEIQELNQRKKDDNFVLKIGDNIVTIKKPQGILRSAINFAEYIQDLFTGNIEEGKEGERLGEWINNAIMDNMPADSITGLVPNMVAPLIENAINKDFYYNTDIVKNYDLELPDSEQYYDYNSQLAIWLGKAFNYSPAKIDNLINGYFAGLGTSVTNVIDYISGKTGISAEQPEMGAEDNAIAKRFIVNINSNSASIDEIYDRKAELTKKKNGETITEKETEELETLTDAISNISKINKQIKEIKKNLTMSGEEKAEQIKLLQQQRTDLARQALGKDVIYEENEERNASIQFYTTSDSLKKNGYTLAMTSEMKKEYEEIAYNYYSKYESQGIYSDEKLDEIKSKAKDYAKTYMFSKYKNNITKTEK